MFEKVNPSHPDKVADRIAGALVDLAYNKAENPKIACEVLLGHGKAFVVLETDTHLEENEIKGVVERIAGVINTQTVQVPQDKILNDNQSAGLRCGDNGIFKGVPINKEEKELARLVRKEYESLQADGKWIINGEDLIICQSKVSSDQMILKYPQAMVNPIGDWDGGIDVDAGATNRKLGSDMGRAVSGGGLHGKDLSKADVSINIFCHILAQKIQEEVIAYCAIGGTDFRIKKGPQDWENVSFEKAVMTARKYIEEQGGFERFAEWGLI